MAQTSEAPAGRSAASTESDAKSGGAGDLNVMGFSMMCAWHFVILFTAMPAIGGQVESGRPLVLQLSLYLSLALSYGLIALSSNRLPPILFHESRSRWNISNIAIGLVASAASALAYLYPAAPLPLATGLFVLLGVSEALLMFPWLELPRAKDNAKGNYRNLAFNMGIGAVTAIIVCNLQSPVVEVVVCILPLLANIMLITSRDVPGSSRPKDEHGDATRFSPKEVAKTNFHFIVVGIVFGISQGAFSNGIAQDGNVTFIMNGMVPLIGAALSAPIVFFVPAKYLRSHGVFFIQRLSILIFMLSVFAFLYFSISRPQLPVEVAYWGDMASQAAFLCGFNVFDFVFMMLAFTWAARLESEFTAFIGYNRLALYLGMGLGLAVGYLLVHALAPLPNVSVLVAGLTTFMLTLSHLPFFDELAPYGPIPERQPEAAPAPTPAPAAGQAVEPAGRAEGPDGEPEGPEGGRHTARWKERVQAIADEYKLSKREREVFSYLAKGRNAAYIHEELWISVHTVKTHMFNIYRKLDVHTIQEIIDMVDNYDAAGGGQKQEDSS